MMHSTAALMTRWRASADPSLSGLVRSPPRVLAGPGLIVTTTTLSLSQYPLDAHTIFEIVATMTDISMSSRAFTTEGGGDMSGMAGFQMYLEATLSAGRK